MPTPELCSVSIRYGRQKNIPVVVDIRDLWPDIFLEVVPRKLQWLAELAMLPMFRMNYHTFKNVSGIVAISANYLKWGLIYSGRDRGNTDKVFYMGYPQKNLKTSEKKKSVKRWIEKGVRPNSFICCFFGSINYQFDLETIISVAKIFKASECNDIQFVICGEGVRLKHYKNLAIGLNNILFPGWVDRIDIRTLTELAKVGLAPYKSFSSNFCHRFHPIKFPLLEIREKATLSNKIFEYFSGGLPIVSSLRGELAQILRENDCGITYEPGDVQGLADALLFLKDNPKKRKQMGKIAMHLFDEKYSSDKVYPAMADHIEELVNKSKSTN
jgi:glycosyltransferase involved in cell wall biosynthesis